MYDPEMLKRLSTGCAWPENSVTWCWAVLVSHAAVYATAAAVLMWEGKLKDALREDTAGVIIVTAYVAAAITWALVERARVVRLRKTGRGA